MNLKLFTVYLGLGLALGFFWALFLFALGLPQWVQLAAGSLGFAAVMIAGSLAITGAE